MGKDAYYSVGCFAEKQHYEGFGVSCFSPWREISDTETLDFLQDYFMELYYSQGRRNQ